MNADSPGGLRAGTRAVGLALVLALLPWSTPRAGGSTNSPSQPPPSQPPPAQAPAKSAQQTRSKKPVFPPPHHILETIIATRAAGILGVKVEGLTGEPMGLVVDIVVGRDGRSKALIIDFGGFLGVGTRKIAIDWRLVHFRPGAEGTPLLIEVSKDDLQAAPEYDPAAPSNKMIGPATVGHPAPPDAGN